jgi:hypothetical protein
MDNQLKHLRQPGWELRLGELPPKLPNTSESLQRAILLLGNRTKTELTDKSRRELVELLGAYPSAEQASTWKQRLKQLVKQRT